MKDAHLSPVVNNIRLELKQWSTHRAVDPDLVSCIVHNTEVDGHFSIEMVQYIITATLSLFSQEVYNESAELVVRYPKDWWEAIKARFFSVKMLKRWPVKYEEVKKSVRFDVQAVYPTINLVRDRPVRFVHTLEFDRSPYYHD